MTDFDTEVPDDEQVEAACRQKYETFDAWTAVQKAGARNEAREWFVAWSKSPRAACPGCADPNFTCPVHTDAA